MGKKYIKRRETNSEKGVGENMTVSQMSILTSQPFCLTENRPLKDNWDW